MNIFWGVVVASKEIAYFTLDSTYRESVPTPYCIPMFLRDGVTGGIVSGTLWHSTKNIKVGRHVCFPFSSNVIALIVFDNSEYHF